MNDHWSRFSSKFTMHEWNNGCVAVTLTSHQRVYLLMPIINANLKQIDSTSSGTERNCHSRLSVRAQQAGLLQRSTRRSVQIHHCIVTNVHIIWQRDCFSSHTAWLRPRGTPRYSLATCMLPDHVQTMSSCASPPFRPCTSLPCRYRCIHRLCHFTVKTTIWQYTSVWLDSVWANALSHNAAPAAWNSLPPTLHQLTDMGVFTWRLKTELFHRTFYE